MVCECFNIIIEFEVRSNACAIQHVSYSIACTLWLVSRCDEFHAHLSGATLTIVFKAKHNILSNNLWHTYFIFAINMNYPEQFVVELIIAFFNIRLLPPLKLSTKPFSSSQQSLPSSWSINFIKDATKYDAILSCSREPTIRSTPPLSIT